MLLGGFLILPSTYDKDPQLRFADGVITIVIVALLTGGYSLTVLLWFACPSPLFRLESIFIPAASYSAFGFLASIWPIITSTRSDPTQPSCALTIVLTGVSCTIYGALAFWQSRSVKKTTKPAIWPVSGQWQETSPWQEGNNGYYSPYAGSTYPLTARSDSASFVYPPPAAEPIEEDAVGQQMASLLRKDPGPSPDPTQSTFHLEWPIDDEGEDGNAQSRHNRARTLSGGPTHLSPGDAIRHGRHNSDAGGALAKLGRAIRFGDSRGRTEIREERERAERARSRDERRREIELGSLGS
ncbi:hypothetical protein BT63DRAFT_163922 [Microthyrium microscopicum]|uniref:Uncharacterized protein n=1 Tax=Microthyrium microscopicum TaxID=703497 RepID=A0A6A6UQF3_9PEZI|nr:hypothetical protein BT63DRAFT_163922 [Microthyrium microscopicum]